MGQPTADFLTQYVIAEQEVPPDPLVVDWVQVRSVAALGAVLFQARRRRGWTLKHLADLSGVSYSNISQIEHGHRQNVRVNTVLRLAAALGIPIELGVMG